MEDLQRLIYKPCNPHFRHCHTETRTQIFPACCPWKASCKASSTQYNISFLETLYKYLTFQFCITLLHVRTSPVSYVENNHKCLKTVVEPSVFLWFSFLTLLVNQKY